MAEGQVVGSVGIIGLGYVGLPLAVAFAEVGLSVVGIERDPDKVASLGEDDSYVEHVPTPYSTPYRDPGYEDMERRKPDARRVAALLDWKPELALDDILERVISYVREQRATSVGRP